MKKTFSLIVILFFALNLFAQKKIDSTNILLDGQKMPSFTITTMDGQTIHSKELIGKTVLINFFATWCGPCRRELPLVQSDIWNKYKDRKDFMLLIISREEAPEKVIPFLEEYKYSMPFYSDIDRSCYSQFAEKYIPRNYLFDESGKLIFQSNSFTEEEFKKLVAVLAEQLN